MRHSENFIANFPMLDGAIHPAYVARYKRLVELVQIENSARKLLGLRPYYLVKRPRLGKNNPHAAAYRGRCTIVKMAHGTSCDIYFYERYL